MQTLQLTNVYRTVKDKSCVEEISEIVVLITYFVTSVCVLYTGLVAVLNRLTHQQQINSNGMVAIRRRLHLRGVPMPNTWDVTPKYNTWASYPEHRTSGPDDVFLSTAL